MELMTAYDAKNSKIFLIEEKDKGKGNFEIIETTLYDYVLSTNEDIYIRCVPDDRLIYTNVNTGEVIEEYEFDNLEDIRKNSYTESKLTTAYEINCESLKPYLREKIEGEQYNTEAEANDRIFEFMYIYMEDNLNFHYLITSYEDAVYFLKNEIEDWEWEQELSHSK